MAAGADLYEVLGPLSPAQARLVVQVLRLTPSQLAAKRQTRQEQPSAKAEPAA
jgi:hypothetical protein